MVELASTLFYGFRLVTRPKVYRYSRQLNGRWGDSQSLGETLGD